MNNILDINTNLLSEADEIRLSKLIKEGGEKALQARNELVVANIRLVGYCARAFQNGEIDYEDICAMGYEGLIKAAEKFDYTFGNKFSTYAIDTINGYIKRGISKEKNAIKTPIKLFGLIYKIQKARNDLEALWGETPNATEISEHLNIPEREILKALNCETRIVSLDVMVGDDRDTSLEELLEDTNAVNPCDLTLKNELVDMVRDALSKLTPREAMVISLRYGIGASEAMTLEEIAQLPEFGVTRERIRQIEIKALRKLNRNPQLRYLHDEYAS